MTSQVVLQLIFLSNSSVKPIGNNFVCIRAVYSETEMCIQPLHTEALFFFSELVSLIQILLCCSLQCLRELEVNLVSSLIVNRTARERSAISYRSSLVLLRVEDDSAEWVVFGFKCDDEFCSVFEIVRSEDVVKVTKLLRLLKCFSKYSISVIMQ